MSKFIHTFIATLCLTMSAPLFLGCDETNGPSEDRSVNLSAEDLASLSDGRAYILNAQDEVTYHIDPSSGDLDLSRVMLLGRDGIAISLEQALRNSPELASIDPTLLDGAAMTISAVGNASVDEDEIALRKEVAGCTIIVVETNEYIIIIMIGCR